MIKITEAKRVELSRDKDRDAKYGPALMGLPTEHGHLDLAPEVGDKFCAAGHPESVAEIVAVAYDARINACTITCRKSDGIEFAQPFARLYKALKAGQAEIVTA